MDLVYACLSSSGPARQKNEDFLGFWSPVEQDLQRSHGALAVIADGVGGQGQGEVASQLAVEAALEAVQRAKPDLPPKQVLWQAFNAANLAVYDRGMAERDRDGRMATTLTAALFRHDELTVAHVGDCRAYLIQDGRIQQITADHSYVAMQVKMGLISAKDAATSEMRSLLTRSVGRDPVLQVDISTLRVNHGDVLVLCCDGLHQFVSEEEIVEIAGHQPPDEACRQLVALAEKRGTDDNLSVQIVRIDRVEAVLFYRGLPIYQEVQPPMSNEVEVGQVLDGRFRVTEVVSRSGMASIFKAEDLTTSQAVALKVPFMQFESDPGFFSRFQREEAIGASLNHPYVLRILPVQEKSRPYIVMEFLEGQTLRQILQSVERMPPADALAIAARICEALEYLHGQNVIHRDLKPENVMLCHDGSIRLMDFGIAKAAGLRRLTFTGFSSSLGTPDYMAPEQVKGKRGDARTDLYSLGIMLYEMVTGSLPFEGQNPYAIMHARLVGDPIAPRKWNPELSPQVEEILLHALERQPFDRYPSAAAMKIDLQNPASVVLTGRCDRLRPQVPWRNRWRSLRMVVLAVVLPLLVLAGLIVAGILRRM